MRCPEALLIARVLEKALMLPEAGGHCRTFDPILRPPAGGEWSTAHGCYDVPTMAAMVLDPAKIVGSRHRHQTRLVVSDIDRHGAAISPYWHPDGPEASPALQRLLGEAEAVGCCHAIFRTPSGGWHVWILLPEAVHHSVAAAIGLALAARADLQVTPGRLEVFPSLTRWSDSPDARHRPRCNGFRLPGQQGGATWIGGAVGWCDEPATAWEEAAAAVELADGAATPAWAELLEEAAVTRRRHRPRRVLRGPGVGRHRPHRPHAVEWTGPGESNDNIGLLTTRLYQPGEAPEQLGERVAVAARACPGFSRYASRDTVSRLTAWCLHWAIACHRRPPRATASRCQSTDPGRNHRLHREAVCRLIDAAHRAAREHGAEVFGWSERRVAEFAQVGRNTLRSLLSLWRGRITAAVYGAPAGGGSDPLPKGVHLRGQEETMQRSEARHGVGLVSVPEINSLDPVPPVAFRPCRPPPPPPLAMPIAPARDATARREHERAELARWLGLAAA